MLRTWAVKMQDASTRVAGDPPIDGRLAAAEASQDLDGSVGRHGALIREDAMCQATGVEKSSNLTKT